MTSQAAPSRFIWASAGTAEQPAHPAEAPWCCRQQPAEPASRVTPAEPRGPGTHRIPAFWNCLHFVFLRSVSAGTNVNAVRELKISGSDFCQFNLPRSGICLQDTPLASQTPVSCTNFLYTPPPLAYVLQNALFCALQSQLAALLVTEAWAERLIFVEYLPLQELELIGVSRSSFSNSASYESTLKQGKLEGSQQEYLRWQNGLG